MRRMADSADRRCAVADLAPGRTLTFRLACGGRRVNGFVVNHGGELRAWVNRCPHVGTPLDLWPNEFYTDDGRDLICSTHGAIFEPLGGRCVGGPCGRGKLTAVLVEERDGNVYFKGFEDD